MFEPTWIAFAVATYSFMTLVLYLDDSYDTYSTIVVTLIGGTFIWVVSYWVVFFDFFWVNFVWFFVLAALALYRWHVTRPWAYFKFVVIPKLFPNELNDKTEPEEQQEAIDRYSFQNMVMERLDRQFPDVNALNKFVYFIHRNELCVDATPDKISGAADVVATVLNGITKLYPSHEGSAFPLNEVMDDWELLCLLRGPFFSEKAKECCPETFDSLNMTGEERKWLREDNDGNLTTDEYVEYYMDKSPISELWSTEVKLSSPE